MKKTIMGILLLSVSAVTQAQIPPAEKRLQSEVGLATGLFMETGTRNDQFPGAVLRLSYGLDVRLHEKWSLMPGAGIRTQLGEINHFGWDGGNPDGMTMADAFCQARYHFVSDGSRLILGLGPQVSYMLVPDMYYVDADPNDSKNGKPKFKNWDFALQPSFMVRTANHWKWGIEASIGLRNMLKQYPQYKVSGSTRFVNLMVSCCRVF